MHITLLNNLYTTFFDLRSAFFRSAYCRVAYCRNPWVHFACLLFVFFVLCFCVSFPRTATSWILSPLSYNTYCRVVILVCTLCLIASRFDLSYVTYFRCVFVLLRFFPLRHWEIGLYFHCCPRALCLARLSVLASLLGGQSIQYLM